MVGKAPDEDALRGRMCDALRRAANQLGRMRDTAGTSLVALLCASAFAPLLTAGDMSGPAALAWMSIAGNVGAEALASVTMQAIDAVRGADGEDAGVQAVTDELAARLEAALNRDDDLGSVLRSATSQLLREVQATTSIVECLAESGADQYAYLSHELAALGLRFSEFSFLYEEIHGDLTRVESFLTDHRIGRCCPTTEQLREQNLLLTEIRDYIRVLNPQIGAEPPVPE
jgi:hypothetical protein